MARFIITNEDPAPYRDRIVQFWDEYLPGTPSQRFEWLSQGNPAGNAIWFFAFEENSRELAGLMSITPKEIGVSGEKIRVGIAGDFMVSSKYRVLGPTFHLVKKAVNSCREFGLHALYTIPNQESRKIMMKSGFDSGEVLISFVKPLDIHYYLAKKVPSWFARVLSPILSIAIRRISLEIYTPLSGCYSGNDNFDESYDKFFQSKLKINTSVMSFRGSSYLKWRYGNNPAHKFRVLSYQDEPETDLSGYIIYTKTSDNRYLIYDTLFTDETVFKRLLKKLIVIASQENGRAIHMTISSNNKSFIDVLHQFRFFDDGDRSELLVSGGDMQLEKWAILLGDRNI